MRTKVAGIARALLYSVGWAAQGTVRGWEYMYQAEFSGWSNDLEEVL